MKIAELVENIDERQRKMEIDFATHQEYSRQMFDQNKLLLSQILEQTTKTNGKVGTNTKDIHDINSWREKLKGMWAVVVIAAISLSTIASLIISLYNTNK